MLQFTLDAQVRNSRGKGPSRQLRKKGMTPAVLYGAAGVENVSLEIETRPFTKALITIQDQNAVLTLNITGEGEASTRHVVVKDIQVHPVMNSLLHADFYDIDLTRAVVLSVPVQYAGKAKGVDMGGDMQVVRHAVSLKGMPLDIPDFIEINVSGLGLGDAITCKDIALPENVTLADDGDARCVAVVKAAVVA